MNRVSPLAHVNRVGRLAAVALLAAGLVAVGCESASAGKKQDDKTGTTAAPNSVNDQGGGKESLPATAIANIQGAGANKDKIKGTVTFIQADNGVRALVDVTGLSPGKHGIHVHEKADLSDPELKGAGGHWNPDGHKHGGPGEGMHHAGDLGNITADDSGHAKTELTLAGVTVKGDKNAVVGHSVIIHEKEDDLKTDPAGNSGARIAGGVIEAKAAADTK